MAAEDILTVVTVALTGIVAIFQIAQILATWVMWCETRRTYVSVQVALSIHNSDVINNSKIRN